MFCLHKATSAVSCVKPNASQWEATIRDDVGFPIVYHRTYRRKFYHIRRRVTYASANEVLLQSVIKSLDTVFVECIAFTLG